MILLRLIYFAYGLVFFLVGFVAAIAARTFRESRIAVTRSLPWLAAFGMLVGLSEWGVIFIPLQAPGLNPAVLQALHVLHAVLLLAGHACLLVFGARLVAVWERVTFLLPVALGAGVLAFAVAVPHAFDPANWETVIYAGAGYGLGLPGAVLAARGLLHQRRAVAPFYPRSGRALLIAAWTFVLSVPIAPPTVPLPWGPARILWGMPAQVLLTAGGVVLAASLFFGLEALWVEHARRLERAERREAMLEERYRLAKRLNDGVIQDLFAAGMVMGAARTRLPEAEAGPLRAVERQLQATVEQLRTFILDLDPVDWDEPNLYVGLNRLGGDFQANALLPVAADFEPGVSLPPAVVREVYTIVHEALANIRRHARASQVALSLRRTEDGLELAVVDNGRGILPGQPRGPGLERMFRSAEAAGGILRVDPLPGGGTRVMLYLPYHHHGST